MSAPLGSYRVFQNYHLSQSSGLALFMTAQALATDATTIVDVGCGRGAPVDPEGRGRRIHDLRAPGRTVIGIDVDPAAVDNPVVDEFRMIKDDLWPLEDGSVDLAFCDWVLEHVVDPTAFVAELHRVLRPGGAFIGRTVNRNSLLSVAARVVPNRKHSKVLETVQPGRPAQDVFPTAYAMNTVPALHRLFDGHFEWAASFHPGLSHYVGPWPKLEKAVAVLEPRLPRRNQLCLIVAARKTS